LDVSPDDAALLAQGSWFGSLPSALQQLMLERSVVRDYNKGEAILRQGELARGLGAVLAGRIHV
jgi:CRP-like cAMP-binding protein